MLSCISKSLYLFLLFSHIQLLDTTLENMLRIINPWYKHMIVVQRLRNLKDVVEVTSISDRHISKTQRCQETQT